MALVATGSGVVAAARGRGAGRAAGSYVLALLLLVALSWLVRPELALLTTGLDQLVAIVGLACAALVAWLFPVETIEPARIGAEAATVSAPPMSDTAQASIAVLPLENLSGAADDAPTGPERQSRDARRERLLARAAGIAARTPNPEQTLARLTSLLETIGRRASYLALFDEFPNAFERVAHLVSASAWAADYLRKHPIVLDELLDARSLDTAPDEPAKR